MISISRIAAIGARKAWLWGKQHGYDDELPPNRPRLLVDVSAILRHDAQTGIQRVVRAVWSELRRRNGEGFLLQPVFATMRHGYCNAPVNFLEGTKPDRPAEPAKVRPGDKFLGLDLSAHLLPHYRSQIKAWQVHGATIHLLVYDLLPLQRPDWFSASAVSSYRRWYNVLVSDADQAICISNAVAKELRLRLANADHSGPLVVRMQMGADIEASVPSTGVSPNVSEILERLRTRPAILMVGTVEPRKGYDAALQAFDWLWRTRPNDAPDLVIVGKPGWKTSELQARLHAHRERNVRLHWLTAVSDEGLCRLYEKCAGVFIASHAEGFGLPLAEAALFRRHVLARDLAVFREQRLPNILYFDDDSPPALGRRLIDLAGLGQTRTPPSAKLTTWSEAVDDLTQKIGIGHRAEADLPFLKAS
jgi:glycosyltransferase involved in cell wall biosynthesis